MCSHCILHVFKNNSKFTCYSVISIFSFLNKSLFSLSFSRKIIVLSTVRHMQDFKIVRDQAKHLDCGVKYIILAKK